MSKQQAGNQDESVRLVRIGGKAYRVRTQVVIEEVDSDQAAAGSEVRQGTDGSFERMLSEEEGTSIDKSEQAILSTCWPAMRNALTEHLHAVSKKKARDAVEREGGQLVVDPTAYRVDGEIGRITFSCHHVVREDTVILDTSRNVFPSLIGKEWYWTIGFKELAIARGTHDNSYRLTADMLNRVRHQPDATPLRTLQNGVEAEGLAVAMALKEKAATVVMEGGFDAETLQPAQDRAACTRQFLNPSLVDATLCEISPDPTTLAVMRANPVGYENRKVSVNVSIDDVLAKKQLEHRTIKGKKKQVEQSDSASSETQPVERQKEHKAKKKERPCVYTTVAHVQIHGAERIFASASVLSTCLLVMAFLVSNQLLGQNLMFFVDGQRSLHSILLRLFAWQGTLQLILDWHHVDKKCRETLSLALNNRHVRNSVLEKLLSLLWYGNVDAAIAYLRQLDSKHVKSAGAVEQLVGYFERNRPYLPCYAARKNLGLRNSSNRGEKANDLVVSNRQKHKGMSWSQEGSCALATLGAIVCNDNHGQWFETGTVDFRMAG